MMTNGILRLSMELLRDFLRLPEQIGIVDVSYDFQAKLVEIYLHDVQRPDVAAGEPLPEYVAVMRSIHHYELQSIHPIGE